MGIDYTRQLQRRRHGRSDRHGPGKHGATAPPTRAGQAVSSPPRPVLMVVNVMQQHARDCQGHRLHSVPYERKAGESPIGQQADKRLCNMCGPANQCRGRSTPAARRRFGRSRRLDSPGVTGSAAVGLEAVGCCRMEQWLGSLESPRETKRVRALRLCGRGCRSAWRRALSAWATGVLQ